MNIHDENTKLHQQKNENVKIQRRIRFFGYPSLDIILTTAGFGVLMWVKGAPDALDLLKGSPINPEFAATLILFIFIYLVECLFLYVQKKIFTKKTKMNS